MQLLEYRSSVPRERVLSGPALLALPRALQETGPRYSTPNSEVVSSVLRLLQKAGTALWYNQTEAYEYLMKVTALLQTQQDGRRFDADTDIEKREICARLRLAPWQIARVVKFVDLHLSEKIRTKDLADSARLSPSHFSRAFRLTVGCPPFAYVIRRRIAHAQGMVRSTDLPLSNIALECGLADQAHLSRLFRRFIGMTPGAWRRTRMNEDVVSIGDAMRRL
jgi:AraC-like DNA-binding protein